MPKKSSVKKTKSKTGKGSMKGSPPKVGRSVYNIMQVSNSEQSENRRFGNAAVVHLKLSTDNLRALQLFANNLNSYAKEKNLGNEHDFGIAKFYDVFVKRLHSSGFPYTKENLLQEFPEYDKGSVAVDIPGEEPNRKRQAEFVDVLIGLQNKISKGGYANARILKTLNALKKKFKALSGSSANSVNNSTNSPSRRSTNSPSRRSSKSSSRRSSKSSSKITSNSNYGFDNNSYNEFSNENQTLALQKNNKNLCDEDLEKSMKKLAAKVRTMLLDCGKLANVSMEEAKAELMKHLQ